MSATLQSPLCPPPEELLPVYGEYIYCVLIEDGNRLLTTAYTRTLVSPILRKNTRLVTYCSIPTLYDVNLPSTQEHSLTDNVYVLDLTSKPVYHTYLKFKARYFPITILYEDILSLLEAYTLDELIKKVCMELELIQYERSNTASSDREFTCTYTPFWYSDDDHPEVVSLTRLINDYPDIVGIDQFFEIVSSPFVESALYTILEVLYKIDNHLTIPLLTHTLCNSSDLLLREYHQLQRDEIDTTLFRPINDPLSGVSLMSDLYIQKCMLVLVGEWVSKLDFSKCVITGSMVAACVTCITRSISPHIVKKFYPTAYTVADDGVQYIREVCLSTHRPPYSQLFPNSNGHNVEFNRLEFTMKGGVEPIHFTVTPGVDVNIAAQVETDEELKGVADMIYTTVKKYWKDAMLKQNESGWLITSPDMTNYLYGFRTIQVFVMDKYSVLEDTLPFTRGYYDGKTLYCTPSCGYLCNKYVTKGDIHNSDDDQLLATEIEKYMTRGYYFANHNERNVQKRDYNILDDLQPYADITIPTYSNDLVNDVLDAKTKPIESLPYPEDIREELQHIVVVWYSRRVRQ